ncbi:AraC-like DNA-binding protein [Hamadaea flava]|uniref:Helix-turn-helix domain-containing protein n=1 Tax=Hamadaea flava TaxID=1742688 RepID=A0ABV8M085_9ACTN|nr:AraC family transcriptional regulator [Hamadaea flava]MCP2328923.1 AraC-like DNA-binding protein [Hamadaea flava]
MADDCDDEGWRGSSGPGEGHCLGVLPGLRLFDMTCHLSGRHYGGTAYLPAYQVILGRSGGYLRQVNGVETFADATSCLVARPGDELRVAHPIGGGDTFTAVQWDDEVELELPHGELTVGDAGDLAHRALVAACHRGIDSFELADRVHHLLRTLAAQSAPDVPVTARPETWVAHRRLVARAIAVLIGRGYTVGLDDLAAEVGASAPHLSRIFHTVTGQSLTAYRNRLRVRAVLADLADGAPNLRALAAAYGFADQSHLTRVMRRHLGRLPSEMQQLVRPS